MFRNRKNFLGRNLTLDMKQINKEILLLKKILIADFIVGAVAGATGILLVVRQPENKGSPPAEDGIR